MTLGGTPVAGVSWTLTLDGRAFRYTADGDDLAADVAQGLVEAIALGSTFTATRAGAVVTLDAPTTATRSCHDDRRRPNGAAFAAATATRAGALSTTHYAQAPITISVPAGPVPAGALWMLTLSSRPGDRDLGLDTYLAGRNGESASARRRACDRRRRARRARARDRRLDERHRADPLRRARRGLRHAAHLELATTRFVGDFGLAVLHESGIHNTVPTAQDLELGE